MKLIFIHGPPAVGKLTVAKALSEATGIPAVHHHIALDCATVLFPFGSPPWLRLARKIFLCFVEESMKETLPCLIVTYVYGRFPGDSGLIESLVDATGHDGGELLVVRLTCDQKQLEERVISTSRSAHNKLNTVVDLRAVLQAYDVQSSIPNLAEFHIDTSTTTAEEVATAIARHYSL